MSRKIIIAESSGYSMAGPWHHRLHCAFCVDNSISLRLEMCGDAPTYRPKGVRHIKTAKQFLDATEKICSNSPIADEIDWHLVCSHIEKYKPDLASGIKALLFDLRL